MKRSKPFMGSGPEVEEPEGEIKVCATAPQDDLCKYIEQLEEEKAELTAQLQQVNLAFAAHLSDCQGGDEEEPQGKRCL